MGSLLGSGSEIKLKKSLKETLITSKLDDRLTLRARWPFIAGAYPGFRSMKGRIATPPGWDAGSSLVTSQHFRFPRQFPGTH